MVCRHPKEWKPIGIRECGVRREAEQRSVPMAVIWKTDWLGLINCVATVFTELADPLSGGWWFEANLFRSEAARFS